MTGMEGATERVAILDSSGSFPRLRDSDVEAVIAKADYVVHENKLTICILTLMNGFLITGEASCVDPRNFNAKLGRELARQKAKDKVWLLEGYLMQERRFESVQVPPRF